MLNLLLVTLGLAWLTELAGLSLALGAFIAGMLVSETEYKHQVETDIRPFHDVLLGLFFITIGMMLDWRWVAQRWGLVVVLVTLPVLFKLALVTLLARGLGASTGVSLRTGLYLIMIVLSVALGVGAVVLRERLLARLGGWNATLVAAAAYAVLVGTAMAVLPVIAETPADFPATVLYDFRLASFAGQLVLWAALGLIFGALVERNGQYAAAAPAGRPAAARLPGS